MAGSHLRASALWGPVLLSTLALAPKGGLQGLQKVDPRPARVLDAGDVPQEDGEPGTVRPVVGDLVCDDRVVHEDRSGRTPHGLLELQGAAGEGWAAAWRDVRNGNLGLFFVRLDLDGKPREAERPFPARGAAFRELDPALALGPGLCGALGWTTHAVQPEWSFNARLFAADGTFRGHQVPMGLPDRELPELAEGGGGSERGRGGRPELFLGCAVGAESGEALYAWVRAGRVLLQGLSPRGHAPGKVECANVRRAPALGRPVFATPGADEVLLAWPAGSGIEFLRRPARGGDQRGSAGRGAPLEILRDPREGGGYWLLVDAGDALALRHLSAHGKVDLEDLPIARKPWGHVDVAAWSEGIAILEQPDAARSREIAAGGRFRLRFLAPDGRPAERGELEVLPPDSRSASGGRIAGAGDRLLVAWSENRGEGVDLYARVLVSGERDLRPERRLNTDEVSQHQKNAEVAAAGGDRAVVAWLDSRDGEARPYVRVVSSRGEFLAPEILLPAGLAPRGEGDPARAEEPVVASDVVAAMQANGSFLAAWTETAGRGQRVRAQLFSSEGRPSTPPIAVEGEPGTTAKASISALALDARRGYLVGWSRADVGYLARRVTSAGALAGAARPLSESAAVGNLALCALDDGRVLAAWDQEAPGDSHRLRARFLSAEIDPEEGELAFETMWRGSDHDPSIAPGPRDEPGSFALAWIAGEDASRDVFARLFDREGRPASRPLALTARAHEQDYPSLVRLRDGSWACAWEDDLSYLDNSYVRRILPGWKDAGPIRTINRRDPVYHENYLAPKLAVVEDGVIAAWNDCRRGQGFDVVFKVFGPGFDVDRKSKK